MLADGEGSGAKKKRYSKSPCGVCGSLVEWQQRKTQFGRLVRAGFPLDAVKQAMPRCQRCVTAAIRAKRLTSEPVPSSSPAE